MAYFIFYSNNVDNLNNPYHSQKTVTDAHALNGVSSVAKQSAVSTSAFCSFVSLNLSGKTAQIT
ncbi:MAG: hypothetical protein LBF59_05625 [Prevotellaceae bacterium]|nr:hypothetical protein [Prevotellaceae bacterium]